MSDTAWSCVQGVQDEPGRHSRAGVNRDELVLTLRADSGLMHRSKDTDCNTSFDHFVGAQQK
jgi:hypothetical protein